MWQLPVEELYMAGKSSVNTLHKLGIYNIGHDQNLYICWRGTGENMKNMVGD